MQDFCTWLTPVLFQTAWAGAFRSRFWRWSRGRCSSSRRPRRGFAIRRPDPLPSEVASTQNFGNVGALVSLIVNCVNIATGPSTAINTPLGLLPCNMNLVGDANFTISPAAQRLEVERAHRPHTPGYANTDLANTDLANTDLSMIKNFKLPWYHSDRANLRFSAEAFNLFNRVNLADPNTMLNSTATFGRCTSARASRNIQFGMRLAF